MGINGLFSVMDVIRASKLFSMRTFVIIGSASVAIFDF